jgi:outer membrane protein assembly factor BamB
MPQKGEKRIPPSDGTVKWTTPFQGVQVLPTLDETRLYAGNADGTLCAFDRTTGETQWCFDRASGTYSDFLHDQPLLVDGDTLYAPNSDGTLYVIDRSTGELHWLFRSKRGLRTVPVVHDHSVYLTTRSGIVYALSM